MRMRSAHRFDELVEQGEVGYLGEGVCDDEGEGDLCKEQRERDGETRAHVRGVDREGQQAQRRDERWG